MATPVEMAVVELQIVIREFHRRLAGIERRLGLEPEEFPPKIQRGRVLTTLPAQRPTAVQRVGKSEQAPYDIAGSGGGTGTLMPERPAAEEVQHTPAAEETVQVKLAEKPPAPPVAPAAPASEPTITMPSAEVPAAASTPAAPAPEVSAPPPAKMAAAAAEVSPAPGQSAPSEKPATPDSDASIPVMPPKAPPPPIPPSRQVMTFAQMYQPAKSEIELERTLGVVVASWLGALAMMAGVLFFLAMAMDYGFISPFTPGVRVSLSLAAGAVMVAHGLWLHRRNYVPLGGSVAGAGLAIMALSVFAAYAGFAVPVLNLAEAFFAIPVIALLAVVLSLHMRLPALAVLAFVGLYLSPAVLNDNADHSAVFLPYLVVITATALYLAQRVASWDVLRLVAFGGAWLWMIGWTTGPLSGPNNPLGFAAIAALFLLFLGVMVYNLWRAQTAPRPADPMQSDMASVWDSIASLFSVINTGAAVLALAVLFEQSHLDGLWAILAALGLAMGALSQVIKTEFLPRVAAVQSVVLLLVALPLGLQDGPITPAFAMVALGFGFYATLMNSAFARAWMFVALVIAGVHLFAVDSNKMLLQEKQYFYGTVSLWMLLGWSVAMLALVLAWLSRPAKRLQANGTTELVGAPWATVGCIAVATVLVFVVNVRALPPEDPFTFAALLWVAALTALLRAGALAEIAQAMETLLGTMLMLLSAKWLVYEGLWPEFNNPATTAWPMFNLFVLNGVLLGAAVVFLNPMREVPQVGRRFVGWWLTALVFALLNVQTLRAVGYFMPQKVVGLGTPDIVKSVCLTMLWAMFACVMVAVGFGRKSHAIRYVALLLLAAAVVKIVFFDMTNAEGLPRAMNFILLGVLLFVVSFLYHRHRAQLPAKDVRGAAAGEVS